MGGARCWSPALSTGWAVGAGGAPRLIYGKRWQPPPLSLIIDQAGPGPASSPARPDTRGPTRRHPGCPP
ncbi:hypothetical protein AV530_013604 [Patagioenas fasciata monilis]|uniref:Uncharacterized protein n=1 Tax=Patagioenas fasciata monilis TaxID=372326 RepID=A0A1V4JQ02_PATFA|nr:hypothetical protein AV530_013604 [Patagioenas fasciata monilis]